MKIRSFYFLPASLGPLPLSDPGESLSCRIMLGCQDGPEAQVPVPRLGSEEGSELQGGGGEATLARRESLAERSQVLVGRYSRSKWQGRQAMGRKV